MRPHHLVLVCFGVIGFPSILTFLSLLRAHPRGEVATESGSESSKSGIRALFSFHTPSTLFPPSAIISLTDDNSTFFLARPADFGPSLQPNGLSGQLWIGSGFGDDNIGRGAPGAGAEGELGCSDIPGWQDGSQMYRRDVTANDDPSQPTTKTNPYGSRASNFAGASAEGTKDPTERDGTDDHLHHPLPSSPVSRPANARQTIQHPPPDTDHPSTHADIQSLQESAEISGKIVLLSRGGCGFLEKVKWAQRRGASALIVGDHTRGGALITMYARGDTSNVTIPSLFTSHTTAHLLSSLIPPEIPVDDPGSGEGSRPDKSVPKHEVNDDRPTFTPTSVARPSAMPTKITSRPQSKIMGVTAKQHGKASSSWLKSLLSDDGEATLLEKAEDSRRPPSSGEHVKSGKSVDGNNENPAQDKSKSASDSPPGDDEFVIGVQDWRDPDLVAAMSSIQTKSTTTTSASAKIPLASKALYRRGERADQSLETAFSGGIITPGSGQYHNPESDSERHGHIAKVPFKGGRKSVSEKSQDTARMQERLYRKFNEEHQGLWVTLTPTTMSTSPFFDTLLVLVVSPLVTLTVVYALLLLRSRVRRRRWRAPKSVVDRLPIRTYHTMSCASTTSASLVTTPQASSPTSPLLHSSPRSVTVRTRPRSATTTGIEDAISAPLDRVTTTTMAQTEKRRPAPAKAKKKYHGKQVECVVCLEEYVDGESKVMSLPCGHEFHAECITPWLTTRRRTCPICKGDVVRSMAQPSSTTSNVNTDGNTTHPYRDVPNDADIQAQAAETANDSLSAAIPIPRDADLEQGDDMAATLVNDQDVASPPSSTWRGLPTSLSLSAFTGEAACRQALEDRDR